MFIEVIATSYRDLKKIQKTNIINRIELCQDLDKDGLTPSYKLMKKICKKSTIPVRIMLRYQNEDFYFHPEEWKQLKKDINYVKSLDANGIVIGFINENLEIDVQQMANIVEYAKPLQITFHKAFDVVKNKQQEILKLAHLGINTVLTGFNEDNLDELDLLRNKGVQIMVGGGVNFENINHISKYCDAIHLGRAIRKRNSWKCGISNEKLKILSNIKSKL